MSTDSTDRAWLQRVVDGDPQAVDEFCRGYEAFIRRVLARRGCRGADADDRVQEVMLKMLRAFQTTFRLEACARFRSYLEKIAVNSLREAHRHYCPGGTGVGGSTAQAACQEIPDDQWLADVRASLDDPEVLEEARIRVREKEPADNWLIYDALVLREQAPADLARALGKTIYALGMTKLRVARKVKTEADRLSGETP